MVIGTYGKSYMVGLIPGQNLLCFLNFPQKNEKPGLISMTQKIDTIIDFFPLMYMSCRQI